MSYEAGRELDALVAEKVMGSPTVAANTRRVLELRAILATKEQDVLQAEHLELALYDSPNGYTRGTRVTARPYSTDIAAAWEVLMKLDVSFSVDYDQGEMFPWIVSIERIVPMDEEHRAAEAETAPLAICLAALKAVGELK